MNAAALAKTESQSMVRSDEPGISIEEIVARVDKIKKVQARVMKEGVHFGVVPGTGSKPTLLKPGAEMLCMTFQLDPQFSLDERWHGEHLEVVVTCTLFHAPTTTRLGSGIGSCSTLESKYAYRQGQRVCPRCQRPAIIKGRDEYGGGWVCFKKKEGCGAKFADGDKVIESQQSGRVANPDIPDLYNTVRKMACKRAHVAACLFVTGGSELFTQDIEDSAAEPEQRSGPHSPHDDGSNDAGDTEVFDRYMAELVALETSIAACSHYDTAMALRAKLGSKATPSELTRSMQQAYEGHQLSQEQRSQLGKLWQRLDRQVAKLETNLAPDVTASFSDADEDAT